MASSCLEIDKEMGGCANAPKINTEQLASVNLFAFVQHQPYPHAAATRGDSSPLPADAGTMLFPST